MFLALLAACFAAPPALPDPPPVVAEVPAPEVPVWPAEGAPLRVLAPPPAAPTRVLIDAGHGAPGNPGNTGVNCQREQDVTKRIQDAVITRLASFPAIAASGTRPTDALVAYPARIALADRAADVMISIHSDVRQGQDLHVDPVTGCLTNHGATGFSVLYSDEGVFDRRKAWAAAIAARMVEAGFPAYDGADYGMYGADPEHPGVFVDRHAMPQRIMILRRTRTPTVIVETHQAIDPAEVARWDEPGTLDAFAAALAAAVADMHPAPEVPPDPESP